MCFFFVTDKETGNEKTDGSKIYHPYLRINSVIMIIHNQMQTLHIICYFFCYIHYLINHYLLEFLSEMVEFTCSKQKTNSNCLSCNDFRATSSWESVSLSDHLAIDFGFLMEGNTHGIPWKQRRDFSNVSH